MSLAFPSCLAPTLTKGDRMGPVGQTLSGQTLQSAMCLCLQISSIPDLTRKGTTCTTDYESNEHILGSNCLKHRIQHGPQAPPGPSRLLAFHCRTFDRYGPRALGHGLLEFELRQSAEELAPFVAMPFALSSFVFLVGRPGAPSSVLVPSSGLEYLQHLATSVCIHLP